MARWCSQQTGRLANNTNLAAKGIVALEAFSRICLATDGESASCEHYSEVARGFVDVWVKEGLEQKPAPHYKIAYNFPNSYSIKYAPLTICQLKIANIHNHMW